MSWDQSDLQYFVQDLWPAIAFLKRSVVRLGMSAVGGHLADGGSRASVLYLQRLLLQRLLHLPTVPCPRTRRLCHRQDAKPQQNREGLMNAMCKSALQLKSWCGLHFSSTASSSRLHAGRLHELELMESVRSPKDCKNVLHEVVVHLLSGRTLKMQLPKDATIQDVKERVRSTWGPARSMQSMVLGEAVLPNSVTVDSLVFGFDDKPLSLTLFLSCADLQIAYQNVVVKIRRERAHATNTRSIAKLVHYLRERDDMEKALQFTAF